MKSITVKYRNEPQINDFGTILLLVYQVHKARDQIIKTLEMIKESRERLTLYHLEQVESKMEYSIRTLMQIRHLLRHEYPEGALVNEWDIFWRQNVYDSPIIKMDQLIDTVSEKVIGTTRTTNSYIVNVSDEDQHLMTKYARKLQYVLDAGRQ